MKYANDYGDEYGDRIGEFGLRRTTNVPGWLMITSVSTAEGLKIDEYTDGFDSYIGRLTLRDPPYAGKIA